VQPDGLAPASRGGFTRLQRQMHMIGHQTKGMHPLAGSNCPFAEQILEYPPLSGRKEHFLPDAFCRAG
jgi:hypothetical protein